MMTKKILMLAVLAVLTAACSSSSNDEIVPQIVPQKPEPVSKGIPFTATISAGNTAMTRALTENETKITTSWAVNEQMALIYTVGETSYNSTATVKNVDGNGTATITATLEDGITDNTSVTIIYPASAADGTTGNVKSDLLTAQNGLLTGDGSISQKYDVRTGSGTLSVGGGTATLKSDVTLANQYAIFKLTLKNIDASDNVTTNKLVISDGSNNVLTTVTTSSATNEMYVAVDPAKTVLKFSIPGQYYNVASGLALSQMYYQSTVKLATYKVGDVIGLNGRCYASKGAATAAGTTAIAMIAYKGTESKCINGLAIALTDVNVLYYDYAIASATTWNNTTHPVSGGTWRVPSVDDWKHMFTDCGGSPYSADLSDNMAYSYGQFRTKLTEVGGTDVKDNRYWSSTKNGNTDEGWIYCFGDTKFSTSSTTTSWYVRLCLSF